MKRSPLPIDDSLDAIRAAVRSSRAAVVVAAPGAGKTTRVPPALLDFGPLILLQPRRVAARAIARRIARENGWRVGGEIGWQIRFEREYCAETRLLVATEGVLAARFESDPLLTAFNTVVIDEFHERSIHADLALAFARQAMLARDDLNILVMSATLDAAPVADFLGGCPIIDVPGRMHSVDVAYRPGASVATTVREILPTAQGHVLCFLPGAYDIETTARAIRSMPVDADVFPLHGSLPSADQDAALRPSSRRKIILATNLAETSLTVDGVTDVVDSGLQKVLRYDRAKAIDRLELERITRDSSEQRAGRAGRTQSGRAWRLWDPRDILRPHREPDIARIDLASPLLDVISWGGDPSTFAWFQRPPADAIDAAVELLRLLGAIEGNRMTPRGEVLKRLPLHPRLAAVLVAAGGSKNAAAACALLSENHALRPSGETTESDIELLLDQLGRAGLNVDRAAEELHRIAQRVLGRDEMSEAGSVPLRRALFTGFPDRVARRRSPASTDFILASGSGARQARESGVRNAEFIVALDAGTHRRAGAEETIIRLASSVDRDWLEPTRRETGFRIEEGNELRAVAFERHWYLGILLNEFPVRSNIEAAGGALAIAVLEKIATFELLDEPVATSQLDRSAEETVQLIRRSGIAGLDVDLPALVSQLCAGRAALATFDVLPLLRHDVVRRLEALAPESIRVPSGRMVRLQYRRDGSVVASVKLQEMFGLADTPRVGSEKRPIVLSLLSPAGRPVQTTTDLRSFWDRTYPEVRKELRGRYPKHPWPDDPWTAPPTARAKRRR